jgi:phosphonopyruvate decarboxylase
MLTCDELYNIFSNNDFKYFTGVPDSTFKDWMKFLDDRDGQGLTNRIAAIERDAVAWASGYHIATGKIGVVYMQNSGLGNIVNPATSLTDPEVYNIPMLLMIGWRGEPCIKDEPQHVKMGKITLELLDILGIDYNILSDNIDDVKKIVESAKECMQKTNKPHALVIKKGLFSKYNEKKCAKQYGEMTREEALKIIVDSLKGDEVIVSTTGKTSRELFEYREEKKQGHQNDFLMVGSMGGAAPFGAEIALQKPNKKVFVFDGDGAVIMGAGALSTIGHYAPQNFYHIIFDNECHDSTGGQPTTSCAVNFEKLALANSYRGARTVVAQKDLLKVVQEISNLKGPQMLVIPVKKGARRNLGRPITTPMQNKEAFVEFLSS